MKYLLFDEAAISAYISDYTLQSIEFMQGKRFVQHLCGNLASEVFQSVAVEYTKDGVLFVGHTGNPSVKGRRVFCIDLEACPILQEAANPSDLLTLVQKTFRLAMKIWNRQPFSMSERYHETKSILFPFPQPDHRRIVIERSNNILRLQKRGIDYPLLAYKYNNENPSHAEDFVEVRWLRKASEDYIAQYPQLQKFLGSDSYSQANRQDVPTQWQQVVTRNHDIRDDFIFWEYERQYESLTDSQKSVVDYTSTSSPLRVEGAAGTGKTISMIMRAYKLLNQYREINQPFHIVFFAHSKSTSARNKELFEFYTNGSDYLSESSDQSIKFITLLEFCRDFANISSTTLIDHDAAEAKNYQLQLIAEVVQNAVASNRIKTFRSLLSPKMQDVFNCEKTNPNVLYSMLQHEFSVQIKGRTNCTIDEYYDIEAIENGLPCTNKRDKELIFSLFMDYQGMLQSVGCFDVDDVTIEALSRLNAPIWRRRRVDEGYDYIIVDEMHLFNINEQSVFHYLTKDISNKDIPICFALDYGQAIGDRGNTHQDYIETSFGNEVVGKKLHTLFRNTPPIADFCVSLAAAGTLMFGQGFSNPYDGVQNGFTGDEEIKSYVPELHLYHNDEEMISQLKQHIGEIMKNLQCKASDIAIVSFDDKFLSDDWVTIMENATKQHFNVLDVTDTRNKDFLSLATPYAINGLEFQAVILLGVDEGRVPQTAGTSDISQHFIRYSAYNLLYLSASRAKYFLRILGSKLNGISTCLEHSIQIGCLKVIDHSV